MRPGRAADHSPRSSDAVMEEYSYISTHPLGHTGPVRGSLYLIPSSLTQDKILASKRNEHQVYRPRLTNKQLTRQMSEILPLNPSTVPFFSEKGLQSCSKTHFPHYFTLYGNNAQYPLPVTYQVASTVRSHRIWVIAFFQQTLALRVLRHSSKPYLRTATSVGTSKRRPNNNFPDCCSSSR